MAKKTEKATKSTAKKSAKQPSKPSDAKDTLIKLAQILLPIAGLFTALSYFLGRLHIESYYYTLGITPHVLVFKAEDYMFSSFNLVIMCLNMSVWLYLYWRLAKPGRRLVLGFPVDKSSVAQDIFMLIMILSFWVFCIWNMFFTEGLAFSLPGFMGLNAGFVIGIGMIIFISLLQWIFRSKTLSFVTLTIVLLALLAFTPSITDRLAEIEAKSDIESFPTVTIVGESELPIQLQSSLSRPEESIEVQLVMTNNGMTYLLKQDNEITDKWEIYAIPAENIEQITYLHSAKNES
jgi:hypothetical protein